MLRTLATAPVWIQVLAALAFFFLLLPLALAGTVLGTAAIVRRLRSARTRSQFSQLAARLSRYLTHFPVAAMTLYLLVMLILFAGLPLSWIAFIISNELFTAGFAPRPVNRLLGSLISGVALYLLTEWVVRTTLKPLRVAASSRRHKLLVLARLVITPVFALVFFLSL